MMSSKIDVAVCNSRVFSRSIAHAGSVSLSIIALSDTHSLDLSVKHIHLHRPFLLLYRFQRAPFNLAPFLIHYKMKECKQDDHEHTWLKVYTSGVDSKITDSKCMREVYLFIPGDFVVHNPPLSVTFEILQITRPFERKRNGRRCQVRGVKLEEDSPGSFVLKTDAEECMVLLGDVLVDVTVESSIIRDALGPGHVQGSGNVMFVMNEEWRETIYDEIHRVEHGVEESDEEPEKVDPALEALEARRRRERRVTHVSENLARSARIRAPNRTIYDMAREGWAGLHASQCFF